MRPIEIACRMCAQQPNEICVDQFRVPLRYYHAERISDAVVMSVTDSGRPIPDDEWNEVMKRIAADEL